MGINNKEFKDFIIKNKKSLPLYFKDFTEFKLAIKNNNNMVIEKVFHNKNLQTKLCKVEKFYKEICRFD
jgi:hypothetical protein